MTRYFRSEAHYCSRGLTRSANPSLVLPASATHMGDVGQVAACPGAHRVGEAVGLSRLQGQCLPLPLSWLGQRPPSATTVSVLAVTASVFIEQDKDRLLIAVHFCLQLTLSDRLVRDHHRAKHRESR